jgi:glutaredoxin-related protein
MKQAESNNPLSVPQIFVKQKYIGGADDLADMFVDDSLAKLIGRPLYP